jgi:hypothetical protein
MKAIEGTAHPDKIYFFRRHATIAAPIKCNSQIQLADYNCTNIQSYKQVHSFPSPSRGTQQEEFPMKTSPSSHTVSIEQVQQATARCLQVHPAVDAVLPRESFLLVELLGRMIYARSEVVEAASLSLATQEELRRWAPPLRVAA